MLTVLMVDALLTASCHTDYLLVIAVALVLNSANVVGYTKCSKQASGQLRDMARNAMTSGLTVRTAVAMLHNDLTEHSNVQGITRLRPNYNAIQAMCTAGCNFQGVSLLCVEVCKRQRVWSQGCMNGMKPSCKLYTFVSVSHLQQLTCAWQTDRLCLIEFSFCIP